MTRRRRRLFVLVGAAGAIGAAVLLLLLYVPDVQGPTGDSMIGAQLYSFETVSVFGGGPWQNISYRGVTFEFHLWCAITPAAGFLCGNATEAGGAVYSYGFADGPPGPSPGWQTWVAPDHHEAVQYREGGTARLLVRA